MTNIFSGEKIKEIDGFEKNNLKNNMKESVKLNNLNSKQLEAAQATEGPLLILAGAGAGKTKTIVERVIEIVRKGAEPRNILCVTFTNKAAAEMRERIIHRLMEEKMIDEIDVRRDNYNNYSNAYSLLPTIKTFHSLGLYILKREHASINLLKNFTILDSDDSRSIVKNFLDSAGYDTKIYDPSKIRNAISREKGDFQSLENYKQKISSYTMEVVASAWEYYNNKLKENGSVDFDDLILRSVELLRDNIGIREKYQNLFKYIHIDEYQDTNSVQYEFSKLLINPEKNNICVVGDTDQNIYSWRGANLKNIMNFENDFKNAKVILLEENYRSTQNILSLANSAIKKNTVRKDKNLFTVAGDGEKIEVLPAFDGDSEAELIAVKCGEIIDSGVNPNDIAILYRTNFQSRLLEEKMIAENIPYNVLGVRFFERKEIKDMMSYLRAALNRDSQVDLKRVFENPKRGIGKVSIAKIFAGEILSGASNKKIEDTYNFLDKIKSMCMEVDGEKYELHEILSYILVESGMEKSHHEDGEDGAVRLVNISELITLAENYSRENYGDFENVLEKFLEATALSSDQDDDKKEKVGVRLMTVHASKGLEFDYVFIVGLETDLFPSRNFSGKNRSKEEEEEERRLFYVAVTRAKKKLFLSYAEMRTIFGERNIAAPSEFLSDLPDETYEWQEIYYKQRNGPGKVVYI